jgi:hypothetical protein
MVLWHRRSTLRNGSRSGRAQSDQAGPSDFIALVGEGAEIEIAEPDRPVAGAHIAWARFDRDIPRAEPVSGIAGGRIPAVDRVE